MCLVPTHMTFVHMNSINETLDIFLQIFMKEMQSIYIFQRHMIHCYILSFTYMLDGCNIKPCEAHQKFKHACLVFGKREFVFNDTVESNRNIARSFLSSWESFFSTWRKGPSGFSAWRKSPSDVQIALNDVSDVPIALNDGSDVQIALNDGSDVPIALNDGTRLVIPVHIFDRCIEETSTRAEFQFRIPQNNTLGIYLIFHIGIDYQK